MDARTRIKILGIDVELRVRKGTQAKPTSAHRDRTKYRRKEKHRGDYS